MACFGLDLFSKTKPPYERKEGDPPEDEYVGSSYVFHLDQTNFKQFLKAKDTVLVMFYFNNKESDKSKKHFKKAAETTKRENHAFAAVDCGGPSANLCYEEEVTSSPYYKLYARSIFIGFNDTPRHFPYTTMRKWVETVNVYTKAGHKILEGKE